MDAKISDVTIVRAIFKKLEEEVIELSDAVQSGERALIVDELADVKFYIDRVIAECGLTSDLVSRYGIVKSALRDSGLRCKSVELRLATEFVEGEIFQKG